MLLHTPEKIFSIINRTLFVFIIVLLKCSLCFSQLKYAVSVSYTPVLNTPDYQSVFGGTSGDRVKLDKRGLIGEMEFVAFPNTVFTVLETYENGILKVTTEDYPYKSSELFIDSRFVHITDTIPAERIKSMPDKKQVVEKLNSLENYPYMWGGNYAEGINELLEFYKPYSDLDEDIKSKWCLKGVDCSGLLYQSTNGSTPRNTSSLINYGKSLDIENKNAEEISQMLSPLDLIVWSGHVIIVLDSETVIESTPDYGVHKSNLLDRLKQVMNEKNPVNDWNSTNGDRFVVRRWID